MTIWTLYFKDRRYDNWHNDTKHNDINYKAKRFAKFSNFNELCAFKPSVIVLCVRLSIIILNVIILSAIVLNVVMPSLVLLCSVSICRVQQCRVIMMSVTI